MTPTTFGSLPSSHLKKPHSRTLSWTVGRDEEKSNPSVFQKVKNIFISSNSTGASKSARSSPTLHGRSLSPGNRSADTSPTASQTRFPHTKTSKPKASVPSAQKIPSPSEKMQFLQVIATNQPVLVGAYLRTFNFDDEYIQNALTLVATCGFLASFNLILNTVRGKITPPMWFLTAVSAWDGQDESSRTIFNTAYQALIDRTAEKELALLVITAVSKNDSFMIESLLENIAILKNFSYEFILKLALDDAIKQENNVLLEFLLLKYSFQKKTIDLILSNVRKESFASLLARFASLQGCQSAMEQAKKENLPILSTAIYNVLIDRKRISEEVSISNSNELSASYNTEEI